MFYYSLSTAIDSTISILMSDKSINYIPLIIMFVTKQLPLVYLKPTVICCNSSKGIDKLITLSITVSFESKFTNTKCRI